jgi:HlyD family secretion protein
MFDPAADPKGKKDGAADAKSNPVQGVFILNKDASGHLRAKFVPVTTGITGATEIEVLSGLNEGQEVVSGPYKILRGLKNNALLKRDTIKVNLNAGS